MKSTVTCVLTPVLLAVITAGPEIADEIVTEALPVASVTAVALLSVPRVDANLRFVH